MIPAELHSRVRAAREQARVTLSAYITELLTNYYFVLGLIQRALDKAKQKEAVDNGVELG